MNNKSLYCACITAASLCLVFAGVPTAAGAETVQSGKGVSTAKKTHETGKPNRLLNEASPYLRQHAYNPIDWYPWGREAFEKARREGKPVFLSVGYSTCHWCHVMERESFSKSEVGAILNKHFIAIKVDRERRPDVDETYMMATQLITRTGGWPNNLFLTADRKPFFAGGYFPRDAFKRLLGAVSTEWGRDRKTILADASRVSAAIGKILNRRAKAAEITPDLLKSVTGAMLTELDSFSGGFGSAPKFPNEPQLLFLLRMAERYGDEAALKAVTLTLDSMLDGGIHDQAGGGFHRYSVDNEWLVPHFEKMLYNQAQISEVLTRSWLLTGTARYAMAARRTLDYVLRELTAPEGGFYSAFDADSSGNEGTYYLWTPTEFETVLGPTDAGFAIRIFGVSEGGNFEGKSILHFPEPPADLALKEKMKLPEFFKRVNGIRDRLRAARAARVPPDRDEKIVTAWNGQMIHAFALAAGALGEPRYRQAAENAARFVWTGMRDEKGRLKRSWYLGNAALDGQQEDYAYIARAFISLYDLTGEALWLERAAELAGQMVGLFRDEKAGDYFMTAGLVTFSRVKGHMDSAIASGNAVALEVFARLAARRQDPEHTRRGEALLAALSGLAAATPQSNSYSLRAADIFLRGESGSAQYFAKGTVRASARYLAAEKQITVALDIAKGWHINANKPLEDAFIPTELSLAGEENGMVKAAYPKALRRKLGFYSAELALYEGRIALTLPYDAKSAKRTAVRLQLQACSDKICLEPETREITLPLFVN